jgi:predicted nucleic acid-binding protein
MYTVVYANLEIEKHKDELLSKSKLDENPFDYLKEFIFSKISFIPLENEPDIYTLEDHKVMF